MTNFKIFSTVEIQLPYFPHQTPLSLKYSKNYIIKAITILIISLLKIFTAHILNDMRDDIFERKHMRQKENMNRK